MILPAIAAQNLAAPGPGPPAGGMPFGPFLVFGLNLVPPTQPALSFRKSLVAALMADPGVSAVAGDRVFPVRVPQVGSLPCVLWKVDAIDRREDLERPTGTAEASVRVAAGSANYLQCDALAGALRTLFDGFAGVLGGTGGVTVLSTVSDGEADAYDPPADNSDRGSFWIVLHYRFLHRE